MSTATQSTDASNVAATPATTPKETTAVDANAAALASLIAARNALKNNPGRYADVKTSASCILSAAEVAHSEGVHVAITKMVRRSAAHELAVSHTISLGNAQAGVPPEYNYGVHLTNALGSFTGRYDFKNSALMANWKQQFGHSFKVDATFQRQLKVPLDFPGVPAATFVLDTEYSAPTFTIVAGFVNFSGLSANSWLNVHQYVTPSLTVGAEISYNSVDKSSKIAGLAQFMHGQDKLVIDASSQQTFGALYTRRLSDHVGISAELEAGAAVKTPTIRIGYDYNLTSVRSRATVDSNFKMSCIVEDTLNGGARAQLGCELDQKTGEYKLGFGLNIQTM